jgi:hypothetical protein
MTSTTLPPEMPPPPQLRTGPPAPPDGSAPMLRPAPPEGSAPTLPPPDGSAPMLRPAPPEGSAPTLPPPPAGPARLPVDPRFRRRWAEARRAEGRRRLRVVVATAGALGLCGAAFGALHSPLFEVRRVAVVGNEHTPRAAILAAAGLSRAGVLMIDAGSDRAEKAVDALPWVLRATFVRHWPWSLVIRVQERSPAALVEAGTVTDVVDATGRVLEAVPPGEAPPELPLLVGAVPAAPGAHVKATGPSAGALGELLAAAAAAPPVLGARGLALSWSAGPGLVGRLAGSPATVLLGDKSDLSFKLAILAELTTATRLAGYSLVDLTVPDRPALTPLNS